MKYNIVDLHCDLLCYLAGDAKRTAYDPVARCSIPQLKAGHVKSQTLAIFYEEGPHALASGMSQLSIYQQLPHLYPNDFSHFHTISSEDETIGLYYAFEGASTFCSPSEPIEQGMARLNKAFEHSAPLYISFTWNDENRFGGGAHSKVGIKEDGKKLLDFMHRKGSAVDLSHASDFLAWDILNYIDQQQLKVPVIASHSNSRKVKDVPRNLPDDLIKEIIRRQGVIGLNFYKAFVGNHPSDMVTHVEHIRGLGGENQIVFGCDFFYDNDLPPSYRKNEELFFSEYANAAFYPAFLESMQQEYGWTPEFVKKVTYQNFASFIERGH